MQMDTLSKGESLSKIVEAYSRPTRIVRGKDINNDVEVRFMIELKSFILRIPDFFLLSLFHNLLLELFHFGEVFYLHKEASF